MGTVRSLSAPEDSLSCWWGRPRSGASSAMATGAISLKEQEHEALVGRKM